MATAFLNGGVAEPRVRFLVHRGFVNESRNPSSELGVQKHNASCQDSYCMLKTTDLRSGKVSEIAQHKDAPAEIAWWLTPARLQLGAFVGFVLNA